MPTNLRMDEKQFAILVKTIQDGTSSVSTDRIAICSILVAISAVVASWIIYRSQRSSDRRRVVAQLHADWWSESMAAMRTTVWTEAERWRVERDKSPAIRHYAHRAGVWPSGGQENRAHARVLFFFADLEALIASKVADEHLAMRLFGVAQYGWFSDYFDAICGAVRARAPGPAERPRYVDDLAAFDLRLKKWERRSSTRVH